MTATKTCANCGATFERPADCSAHHWNKRRFCCSLCSRLWSSSMLRIPHNQAKQFAELVNAGASRKKAALTVGRSASSLVDAAAHYGFSFKSAHKAAQSSKGKPEKGASAPPLSVRPPEPPGSPLFWDALGIGISYAEARAMTAHMRAR